MKKTFIIFVFLTLAFDISSQGSSDETAKDSPNTFLCVKNSWAKLVTFKWDQLSSDDAWNIGITTAVLIGGYFCIKILLKPHRSIFHKTNSNLSIESVNPNLNRIEYETLALQVKRIIDIAKDTHNEVKGILVNRFGPGMQQHMSFDANAVKGQIYRHLIQIGTPTAMILLRDLEQINYSL